MPASPEPDHEPPEIWASSVGKKKTHKKLCASQYYLRKIERTQWVQRLYVVECVYFRIKLNGLGHGRGWTERPNSRHPQERPQHRGCGDCVMCAARRAWAAPRPARPRPPPRGQSHARPSFSPRLAFFSCSGLCLSSH